MWTNRKPNPETSFSQCSSSLLFLINISVMSCKFPFVYPLLLVVLSVLLVTTQSFSLRILLETSSSMKMTPSLGFLTAFSSPSLLSGHLCTHLCPVDWLLSFSHLLSFLSLFFLFKYNTCVSNREDPIKLYPFNNGHLLLLLIPDQPNVFNMHV